MATMGRSTWIPSPQYFERFACQTEAAEMAVGDEAFFYHSNCKKPGIAGIVTIIKEAYPGASLPKVRLPCPGPQGQVLRPEEHCGEQPLVATFLLTGQGHD